MELITDIGKIYCKYDKNNDKFFKYRIVGIEKNEKDPDKDCYIVVSLDDNNHIIMDSIAQVGKDFKIGTICLKSEGIVALTNVVSVSNETTEIKDVLAIFFKNNKSGTPDVTQPIVVARQGINNIFAEMAGEESVGMAVSIDTVPVGWALTDFMENQRVINSTMSHVYKTDIVEDLAFIMHNDDSAEILKDLYDHEFHACETIGFDMSEHKDVKDDCLNGYCNSIKEFMTESDFMSELYNTIGIIEVDFKLQSNSPIVGDDLVLLSALCGGVHIKKAVPIKFDYDINIESVKMRYMLVLDSKHELWIVPYTIYDNEIDADEIYKLNMDTTKSIQDRLKNIVKAYDTSKGQESGSIVDMLNN